MGESGQVVLVPGVGDVKPIFEERGLAFEKNSEMTTPNYYKVDLEGGLKAEMSASKLFPLLPQ